MSNSKRRILHKFHLLDIAQKGYQVKCKSQIGNIPFMDFQCLLQSQLVFSTMIAMKSQRNYIAFIVWNRKSQKIVFQNILQSKICKASTQTIVCFIRSLVYYLDYNKINIKISNLVLRLIAAHLKPKDSSKQKLVSDLADSFETQSGK